MNTKYLGADSNNPHAADALTDDIELSLLEILLDLWAHKWLLTVSTVTIAILSAGITLLMPNYYTATARIILPQQSSSNAAALLGQIGGAAALTGGSIAGIRTQNDLYVGIMRSRTVGDRLVERFHLADVFATNYPSDARGVLERISKISSGRDGIISISLEAKDPKLAADLANGYVDELARLTSTLALTEASQRRVFFERQLAKTRDNLANAELAAREALAKGGLSLVEGQGRSLVEVSARLRAQITAKEVQISAMRAFAANTNPDLQLAQREATALRAELARIEGAQGAVELEKPRVTASESGRLLRELRYQEALQELLARQTEAARLDEARDVSALQVLDAAIAPDRKSSPRRFAITIISTLFGLFVISMAIVARKILQKRSGVIGRVGR